MLQVKVLLENKYRTPATPKWDTKISHAHKECFWGGITILVFLGGKNWKWEKC